ncbi:Uncharacterised protein [Vibrio cholerae]|nr:Uncharacterised protein [Vibrio cholerae]
MWVIWAIWSIRVNKPCGVESLLITLTWIPELRSCCNAVSGPISSEPIRWVGSRVNKPSAAKRR